MRLTQDNKPELSGLGTWGTQLCELVERSHPNFRSWTFTVWYLSPSEIHLEVTGLCHKLYQLQFCRTIIKNNKKGTNRIFRLLSPCPITGGSTNFSFSKFSFLLESTPPSLSVNLNIFVCQNYSYIELKVLAVGLIPSASPSMEKILFNLRWQLCNLVLMFHY